MNITTGDSCNLDHLGALCVEGRDAAQFLHGQVTSDVKGQAEGTTSFGGICTPKGRVIATFRLYRHRSDLFFMILPKTRLEAVKQHLERYRLRASVTLSTNHAYPFVIGQTGTLEATVSGIPLSWPGRHARTLWLATQLPNEPLETTGSQQWQLMDMEDGRILIGAAVTELFTPHMLGMDLTDGISLNKGCYTGQEVVARTHYLGEAKRRPTLWKVEGAVEPSEGEKILGTEGQEIGTVIACQASCMAGITLTGYLEQVACGASSGTGFRLVSDVLPLRPGV